MFGLKDKVTVLMYKAATTHIIFYMGLFWEVIL